MDLEVFYLGHVKNLYTIQYNTRTNLMQDFTAVTFSMKLGVIREKLTLPRNPVKFDDFPGISTNLEYYL